MAIHEIWKEDENKNTIFFVKVEHANYTNVRKICYALNTLKGSLNNNVRFYIKEERDFLIKN